MSKQPRHISHVTLIDANDNVVLELLSSHFLNRNEGENVALMNGSIVTPGQFARSAYDGGRIFVIEHAKRHRLGLASAPYRHRAIVELVVARECQSSVGVSRP